MCCKCSNSSAQQNSQLHHRSIGGPEAVLDVFKDSKYPHTTCSALSLSWRREDNVLSHPPTLTTFLPLLVCEMPFAAHNPKKASLRVCVCACAWKKKMGHRMITTMNISSKDKNTHSCRLNIITVSQAAAP